MNFFYSRTYILLITIVFVATLGYAIENDVSFIIITSSVGLVFTAILVIIGDFAQYMKGK